MIKSDKIIFSVLLSLFSTLLDAMQSPCSPCNPCPINSHSAIISKPISQNVILELGMTNYFRYHTHCTEPAHSDDSLCTSIDFQDLQISGDDPFANPYGQPIFLHPIEEYSFPLEEALATTNATTPFADPHNQPTLLLPMEEQVQPTKEVSATNSISPVINTPTPIEEQEEEEEEPIFPSAQHIPAEWHGMDSVIDFVPFFFISTNTEN